MKKIPVRKVLFFGLFSALACALLFVLIEGAASTLLFLARFVKAGGGRVAEWVHVEYDSELGWVNLPNVRIDNMYGEGIYLATNSQRFRNVADFGPQVPEGRLRVVCSGDSFTLGYGVDNDHSWSALLEAKDPRLQTVNMGQGGYGVDQAYLWYRRDAAGLDHDVHLLALITNDFQRMENEWFLGYGRPLLEIRDGALVVGNAPVPQGSGFARGLRTRMATVGQLRMAELGRKVRTRLFASRADASAGGPIPAPEKQARIVAAIFQDLRRLNEERGSIPVVVYLPTRGDHAGDGSDEWRRVVREETKKAGIALVDLFDDFRALPPREVARMFIPEGAVGYRGAAGHYTEEGNAVVADLLCEKIRALPGAAEKFDALEESNEDADDAVRTGETAE